MDAYWLRLVVEPVEPHNPAMQAAYIFAIVAAVLAFFYVLYRVVKIKR
ncbi:MAG TPA: hypothetical protein VM328_01685 [Fimbriimonadaceae bacterium]|nr:hypothetical protein [Fimbriimonadaceae bacterium]